MEKREGKMRRWGPKMDSRKSLPYGREEEEMTIRWDVRIVRVKTKWEGYQTIV